MGVLLLLAVVLLAFLCGRLQMTVNGYAKRLESVELELASIESVRKYFVEED